jgi:Uncharacterized protein conserved in bacteria
MAVYIALLRGINVGGKNIIKMADLKKMFESLGFSSVQTYIQSGNVLFQSDEDQQALTGQIETEIKAAFHIDAAVILRTTDELQQIVGHCPFSDLDIKKTHSPDYETLYVAFLACEPLHENIEQLDAYVSEADQYKIIEKNVYLLFHHSIRDSKLAANIHRLNVPSTVRNFKSITKLAELSKNIMK